MRTDNNIPASCRCGKVALEVAGAPIVRSICYCSSCQAAGGRHQEMLLKLLGAWIAMGFKRPSVDGLP
jgi:hypothetical protein